MKEQTQQLAIVFVWVEASSNAASNFSKNGISQIITKQKILFKLVDAMSYFKFVIRPCLSFEEK